MPVSFDRIDIGREYNRPETADLWGYESFHAISRGIVTPRNPSLRKVTLTLAQRGGQVRTIVAHAERDVWLRKVGEVS